MSASGNSAGGAFGDNNECAGRKQHSERDGYSNTESHGASPATTRVRPPPGL